MIFAESFFMSFNPFNSKKNYFSLFILIVLSLISGCATIAWKEYPMAVNPDYSCRVGSASGYNVWVWNCLNNQHIVIHQVESEMGRAKAKKEISACGELTKIEKKLKITGKSSEACNKTWLPYWDDQKIRL